MSSGRRATTGADKGVDAVPSALYQQPLLLLVDEEGGADKVTHATRRSEPVLQPRWPWRACGSQRRRSPSGLPAA